MWELAHGIDHRSVVPDREAKSISHETTFATDIDDPEALRACLLELTEQVARRLRRHALRGRTVEIKVRFADFRTITRSRKLPDPTCSTNDLWKGVSQITVFCVIRVRRNGAFVLHGVRDFASLSRCFLRFGFRSPNSSRCVRTRFNRAISR
ncbi:MAG: hypothetical protein WBF93_17855 [Pirellulales bacterium]